MPVNMRSRNIQHLAYAALPPGAASHCKGTTNTDGARAAAACLRGASVPALSSALKAPMLARATAQHVASSRKEQADLGRLGRVVLCKLHCQRKEASLPVSPGLAWDVALPLHQVSRAARQPAELNCVLKLGMKVWALCHTVRHPACQASSAQCWLFNAVWSMLAGQSRLQQAMSALHISFKMGLISGTFAQLTHHPLTQDAHGSQMACPCATACAPLRGGPWPPLTCLPCWLSGHTFSSASLLPQVPLWSCAWLRSSGAFL